jgi:protein gp37
MGDGSAIEWTEATWNPVVGCSKVSPGCANCYAEELHRTRLDGRGAYPAFRPWTPANAGHNVTLVPGKLDQPLRWRKPRMIFVNSMSDLFHELVPFSYVDSVVDVMRRAPSHTFQVLTKRPERMRDYFLERSEPGACVHMPEWPLPNVWLGTSIENRRFVGRADALRETPAAVRFVSAEPLLGPLLHDASDWRPDPTPDARFPLWEDGYDGPELNLYGIDWLITGGESGPRARPVNSRWCRDLRDACRRSGVAYFHKQWGGRTPKAGGRELDGRTWDEMPALRSTMETQEGLHV